MRSRSRRTVRCSPAPERVPGNLSTNELGTVKIWRVSDGALVKEVPVRTGSYAGGVEFSHDGHLLATSGATGYVELWDVSNWERVVAIPLSQTTYTARFSPDDQLLVTSGTKNDGNVWKVSDGSPVSTLSGHTYSVSDARFSPDSPLIATTGYDDTVRIWNPTTGAQLQVLAHSGQNHYLSSVVWRDNNHFVSNDWRGSLRFWQRTANSNFTLACSIETYGQSLGLALLPTAASCAQAGRAPSRRATPRASGRFAERFRAKHRSFLARSRPRRAPASWRGHEAWSPRACNPTTRSPSPRRSTTKGAVRWRGARSSADSGRPEVLVSSWGGAELRRDSGTENIDREEAGPCVWAYSKLEYAF